MCLNRLCMATLLALSLAGCSRIHALWDTLVVGPDMARQGPFQARHIVLSGEGANGPAMRIEIRHGDTADDATLTGVLDGTKPYLADVTWHAFTPIVAETNAARMDYWIVGLNLTRTPDRSVYSVLRFPHGADLAAGGGGEGFEYAFLSCDDLDFARKAEFEGDDHKAITLDPAPPPEAGDCEFNSLDEAYAVTPHILKNYDRVKRAKDAPALNWRPVKVALD